MSALPPKPPAAIAIKTRLQTSPDTADTADAAVVRAAIVPAAGLGTRLAPLSLGCPKELLPLGSYPALTACLLELAAADLVDLVLVSSPQKPGLRRFCDSLDRWADSTDTASSPTAALAALWHRLRVRVVDQPRPLGVLDAVEWGLRALAVVPGASQAAVAVLFPDLLHLPDQTALSHLCSAHRQTGRAVFGLRRAQPDDRPGSTLAVRLAAPFCDLPTADLPLSTPLPIVALQPASGHPQELLTTFGQVQTPAWNQALDRHCRDADTGTLQDAGFLSALNALASEAGLFGILIPGQILDLGTLSGYAAAVQRFSVASSRLRDVP